MVRNYKPKTPNLPAEYKPGFLDKMDKRTELAQRLGSTYAEVVEDCGGADALPRVKLCLVERFVWLEEFLRQLEVELSKGVVDRVDLLGKWTQAVNSMNGLSKVLGIANPSKPGDWIDAQLYGPEPEKGD